MAKITLTTDTTGKVTSVAVDGAAWTAPAVVASTPVPPAIPMAVNSGARISYSMLSPHEGAPHGVPTFWDWAKSPLIQAAVPPAGMSAITFWGQVYADSTGVVPANVRVAFRNLQTMVWSKSGNKWLLVQSAGNGFDGGHYHEDFQGNESVPWSQRTEADGSISVDMVAGYNAHFYPQSRGAVNPADVAGVFTTVQAKLIVADASKPDNRSQARWLCNVGADWWRDLSVPYGDGSNNPGVGQGRFMYLSSYWQAFNFHTFPSSQMKANLPPLL